MLQALGLAYPAIIVRDMEDTIRFYERLGLRPLYVEPNRDDPESITAMLYCGANDTFLQLVGPMKPGSVNIAQASPGIGSMQYISLNVTLEQMREMWHQMSTAGVQGSEEIQRGFERLVFLEDPNGVLITLTAWGTEPPPGMPRALVLQRAAHHRDQQNAQFLEDQHIQLAIADIEQALQDN